MGSDSIGNANRLSMPGILYGTAWKKEKTADCVRRALTWGFRGIDTACQPKHYFEAGVGEGVAAFLNAGTAKRGEVYLQTKFTPLSGQDPRRVPYDPRASLAEHVEQSFQTSLRNLQTDYLDGLVLHSPLATNDATRIVWQAMERLVDRGVVRQLGISNCYELPRFESLFDWARIKPTVLQNRFYSETDYDRELRAYCRTHAVVYQSFWTLSANPHVLTHPAVAAIASKYGATPAQVLFRYLTQQGVVPLTGTQSDTHMGEDLKIFEFSPTSDECAAVAGTLL